MNPTKPSEDQYQTMKLKNLQSALIDGEQSGDAGVLDMEAIKLKAQIEISGHFCTCHSRA